MYCVDQFWLQLRQWLPLLFLLPYENHTTILFKCKPSYVASEMPLQRFSMSLLLSSFVRSFAWPQDLRKTSPQTAHTSHLLQQKN